MNDKTNNPNKKLRDELIWLVIAKIALLFVIWWFFIGDQLVAVDPKSMGNQVIPGARMIVTGDK